MPRTLIYKVTGMSCTSCEQFVTSVLASIPGVIETDVSVKQGRAGIRLLNNVTESGVIPFSCGMGMIRGSFIVTDSYGKDDNTH